MSIELFNAKIELFNAKIEQVKANHDIAVVSLSASGTCSIYSVPTKSRGLKVFQAVIEDSEYFPLQHVAFISLGRVMAIWHREPEQSAAPADVIAVGDLVRIKPDCDHMYKDDDDFQMFLDAICVVNSVRGDVVGIDYPDPVGDWDYIMLDCIELVDIAALSSATPDAPAEDMPSLGVQPVPDDPRIYNRKDTDGNFPPLAGFFEGHKSAPAPAFAVGDKVRVITRTDVYAGRCGVVVRVGNLSNGVNYRVKLDLGNNDMHRFYHADDLELAAAQQTAEPLAELQRLKDGIAHLEEQLKQERLYADGLRDSLRPFHKAYAAASEEAKRIMDEMPLTFDEWAESYIAQHVAADYLPEHLTRQRDMIDTINAALEDERPMLNGAEQPGYRAGVDQFGGEGCADCGSMELDFIGTATRDDAQGCSLWKCQNCGKVTLEHDWSGDS